MDLNAIRARLDSLNKQSNSQNNEKKDYSLIYWFFDRSRSPGYKHFPVLLPTDDRHSVFQETNI